MKYPYPTDRDRYPQERCPICGNSHISNAEESDEYTFTSEGHEITFNVKKMRCTLSSKCQFTWPGEVTHDRITWETYKYFSTLVIDEEWEVAATQAVVNVEAYNTSPVVRLMKSSKVPINEMETWAKWARNEYPSLFKSNAISGIGVG